MKMNGMETDYMLGGDDSLAIWKYINIRYFCEEEQKYYVDAWKTNDDNEEGKLVAKIDLDGNVEYMDNEAKIDTCGVRLAIACHIISKEKIHRHGGVYLMQRLECDTMINELKELNKMYLKSDCHKNYTIKNSEILERINVIKSLLLNLEQLSMHMMNN